MDDNKKKGTGSAAGVPGPADPMVRAGLTKQQKVMNTGGSAGRASGRKAGTNRGSISGSNPKFSSHVGTKGGR